MSEEIWKNVFGADDYIVSNHGRVARVLSGAISSHGYHVVNVSLNDGEKKTLAVHRLVLETFNPNENMDDLVVNHIDFNKLNNNIENLEWCTQKQNIRHSAKHGRWGSSISVYCYETDKVYKSHGEAARDIFSPDTANRAKHIAFKIGEVCKQEKGSYKGYHFKYADEEVAE